MTLHTMDCAEFDGRLADYLEGTLDAADRRAIEAHLATCVRCAALVRDLEDIRASAARLPELAPSTDLWSGIAGRIEAPVVPLASRATPNAPARQRLMDRLRTAAIAAALVAVTAGVTYTLTISRSGTRALPPVAANPPRATAPDTTAPSAGPDSALPQSVSARELATAPPAEPGRSDSVPGVREPASTQRVLNVPGAVTYSREIDRLRTIFARNRSQLDPRTAAIIEANLKVIDDAIAQSKAALAQDPASRFLTNQLNSALDKKLELLRTAALLPNRT
jgi:anti-sigma factor RsiW